MGAIRPTRYEVGSYWTDDKTASDRTPQLWRVQGFRTTGSKTTHVGLEECETRFDDLDGGPQVIFRTFTWCAEHLVFRRAAPRHGEMLHPGDCADAREWGGVG